MATDTLLTKLSGDGDPVEVQQTFTGTIPIAIDGEPIADSTTDQEITIGIDVSAIQVIVITADQDLTIETNSATVPDDTINLLANIPYEWAVGSYFTNLLTTDITSIFVTNSSGSATNLYLRGIVDGSP